MSAKINEQKIPNKQIKGENIIQVFDGLLNVF